MDRQFLLAISCTSNKANFPIHIFLLVLRIDTRQNIPLESLPCLYECALVFEAPSRPLGRRDNRVPLKKNLGVEKNLGVASLPLTFTPLQSEGDTMPGPLRILFSEAYYHVARGNEEGQFFRTIQVALSFRKTRS